MVKILLAATFAALVAISPAARADDGENPWGDSATTGDKQGNFTFKTDRQQPYIHENKGRLVQGVYRQAQETVKQTGSGLQTSQGGPMIFFGRNTFVAPQNLALQTQNHSVFGGKLQPTHLDSFVEQSGKSFTTYGDEGTYGPPPLTNFSYINSGIQGNLTTGHPSDAPSAWGTPLKYNSAGGVIQGQ